MYNLLCRRPQTSVAPFFLDRGGQQFASVVFWRVLLILKIGQVKNCSCVFFARGGAGQVGHFKRVTLWAKGEKWV